jgi:RNA polymerase sigma-70 factor (ECF subfamily)
VSEANFDEFYSGASPRLVRQLFLLTGDVAEAEDVVNEAFERAWLHWSHVRLVDSPEAWVRTVARRLAVSRWRRVRNAAEAWRRHGPPEPDPVPLGEHVDVVNALRQLPLKQRTAVVLHHMADLSVEQVAAETGNGVSAVKQQLVRGRAALAKLLQESADVSAGTGDVS